MQLQGRRVCVAGSGLTGHSIVRAVQRHGGTSEIVDDALGTAALPPDSDLVVTSPGWQPSHPLFAEAAERGVPVIGDVELAWQLRGAGSWVVVTGTNGKTTTTEMLVAILRADHRDVVAAGNIGIPVLDVVEGDHEVLALELSSFQLHWAPSVVPAAAAVLNIADDHIDWHGDVQAYARAKAQVFRSAQTLAVGVLDDVWSSRLLAEAGGRQVGVRIGAPGPGQLGVHVDGSDALLIDRAFSTGAPDSADLLLDLLEAPQLADRTLLTDALVAAALARAQGVAAMAVAEGLRGFVPGRHRNETVAVVRGVTYVDDSKATNPHAALASITSRAPVVWIAGGLNKGMSFDALVRESSPALRAAVLLGQCAEEIAEALARHAPQIPVVKVSSMDDGVREAARLARGGDTVLLAPAVASMDMFRDYQHRGEAFASAVASLEQEVGL
jgi:UDP-N-acetylmuramoylalanine--D-glutamate ligase